MRYNSMYPSCDGRDDSICLEQREPNKFYGTYMLLIDTIAYICKWIEGAQGQY